MREGIDSKMSSKIRKLSIDLSKLGLRIRTPTPTNSDNEIVGSGDESVEDSPSTQRRNGKKPLETQQGVGNQRPASHLADNELCDETTACAKPDRPKLSHRSRSDMAKYSAPRMKRAEDSPKTDEDIPEDQNENKQFVEELSPMAKCAPLVRPGLRRKSRSDLVKYNTISRMEGISGVNGKSMSDDDLQRIPPMSEAGRETLPKVRYQVAPVQQADPGEKRKRFKARRSKSFTSLLGGKNKSKETSDSGSTEKRTFPRRRSFSGKQERKKADKEVVNMASSQSNSPTPMAYNEAKPTNSSRYRDALSAGLVPGLIRIQRPSRKSWTYEDILGAPNPLFLGLSTKHTVQDDGAGAVRSDTGSMMETDFCSTEL